MTDLIATAPPAPTLPTTDVQPSTLDRWSRWLAVWCTIIVVIGLGMVLVSQVTGELFNLVLFGGTATPAAFASDAVEYQRFIWAVAGAITIGWMLLAIPVARGPFRRGESWAWRALVQSFAGWFVVDSVLSVALGFAENVAVNVLFVAGAIPPLLATRPRRR